MTTLIPKTTWTMGWFANSFWCSLMKTVQRDFTFYPINFIDCCKHMTHIDGIPKRLGKEQQKSPITPNWKIAQVNRLIDSRSRKNNITTRDREHLVNTFCISLLSTYISIAHRARHFFCLASGLYKFGTNRTKSWSEKLLEEPRAAGCWMNVLLPCSSAPLRTVSALCCSPSRPTHICTFPPVWEPYCRSEEGTAAPSSCRTWGLQGDARCTGRDAMSPGTGENTWSGGGVWWCPCS